MDIGGSSHTLWLQARGEWQRALQCCCCLNFKTKTGNIILLSNIHRSVQIIQRDRVGVAEAVVGCEGGFSVPAAGLGKPGAEVTAVRIPMAVLPVEVVVLSRHRPNQP